MNQSLPVRYAEYVQICKELKVQPRSATDFINQDEPLTSLNKEIDDLLRKESQKYLYNRMGMLTHIGNGDFDSYISDVEKQGISKADIEENQKLIEYVTDLNKKLDELRDTLSGDLTEEQEDTKETLKSLKEDHSNYLEVIEKLKQHSLQVDGLTQAIDKVTSLEPTQVQVQTANKAQKAQLASLPFWSSDLPEEQQNDLIHYLKEMLQAENEQRDLDEERNQKLRELTEVQEEQKEGFKKQTDEIKKSSKKTSDFLKDSSTRMLAHFKMSKQTQDSLVDLLTTIAPLLILWGIGKLTEVFPGVTGRTDEKYEDTVGTLPQDTQEYINEQVQSEENQKTVSDIMKGDLTPATTLGKITEKFHNIAAAIGLRDDYSTSSFYKDENTGEYVIAPSTLVGEDGLTGEAVSPETVLKQLAATSIEDQASSGIYRFKSKKDLDTFMDMLEDIPKDATRQERRESFGEALRKTSNNIWFDYDYDLFRSKSHPNGVETKQNNARGVNPETGLTSYNAQPITKEDLTQGPSLYTSLPTFNMPELAEQTKLSEEPLIAQEQKDLKQTVVNNVVINNYNAQYTQSTDVAQTT